MSDGLIEKCARAIWIAEVGHQSAWPYDEAAPVEREIAVSAARAAIAILAKPENISDSAIAAFWAQINQRPHFDGLDTRKAIAASIQSLLKTD